MVSGFAGGIMNSQEPAPAANFDVKVTDDSFSLSVLSLAGTLPSKDIMITLSSNGMMRKVTGGTANNSVPFGFNIVESGSVLHRINFTNH